MSMSMSSPGLAESNRAPRTENGNDSAQTNKTNDARTKQWPVRPGWWVVGGVRDERLQRVASWEEGL